MSYERTPEIREKNRQATVRLGWRREKHPYWRGGKYIEPKKGYVMIRRPRHPRARKNGYVLEHILVMEDHLGRMPSVGEMIHHKNGVKSDNRISNLVLTNASEHAIKYDAHHPNKGRSCSMKGCINKHLARGYCKSHYRKLLCDRRGNLIK